MKIDISAGTAKTLAKSGLEKLQERLSEYIAKYPRVPAYEPHNKHIREGYESDRRILERIHNGASVAVKDIQGAPRIVLDDDEWFVLGSYNDVVFEKSPSIQ